MDSDHGGGAMDFVQSGRSFVEVLSDSRTVTVLSIKTLTSGPISSKFRRICVLVLIPSSSNSSASFRQFYATGQETSNQKNLLCVHTELNLPNDVDGKCSHVSVVNVALFNE